MEWTPKPGDRIKTVITKDTKNELIYLNGDHAIEATICSEFLIFTGEFIPWAHQIIDYLSKQPGKDRRTVLQQLLEFEARHKELDFDELCLLFLDEHEKNNSVSFFTSQQ